MPLSTFALRLAAKHASIIKTAASLREAKQMGSATAFLSHSHEDRELAKGLEVMLKEHGWDVYLDWQDNSLPDRPNRETAAKIKSKIASADWFLFLATSSSVSSRWCPWEIGLADALKGSDQMLIIPTANIFGEHHGNEYLQLYPRIDVTVQQKIAAFDPGRSTGGILVEDL